MTLPDVQAEILKIQKSDAAIREQLAAIQTWTQIMLASYEQKEAKLLEILERLQHLQQGNADWWKGNSDE